jgi:serine/threonine protein kinase
VRSEVTEKLPNPFSNAAADLSEPSLAPDPASDLIGRVIGGRYKVTRVVGRGGMGVVYGGEHLELGLPVAIKVLPTSYARDTETLKRFEREARTASRVRHPNVVTVFDLGRLDSGEPYLAMELLDGHDLSDIVDGGRSLPLRKVLDILEPLAAALDALHKEGVVHRDIKPSNIFFSRGAGGVETLKLVDFGLAALHSGPGSERLTRSGHVIGTAIYMAPEGARGALVGPAGDIYSLGVVAFELLTGIPPFDGQPMAVLMDKVAGVAPTLSKVSGRPFDPRLEAIIASSLSRTPEERPRTAADLVRGMLAVLDAGGAARSDPPPPPAAPLPSSTRSSPMESGEMLKLPAPSRTPMIAAALVVLLTLGAGGAWLAMSGASTPTPAPTPTPVVPSVPTPPVAPVVVPETIVPDPPAPALAVGVDPPVAAAPTETGHVRPDRPRTVAPSSPPPPTTTTAPAHAVETAPQPADPAPAGPEAAPDSTDRTTALLRDASSAMLHGEIPHAQDLYREATLAAPRNAAAWRGLGLASERLGLVPEARRAYTRYLELAPEARDATTVRERLERL